MERPLPSRQIFCLLFCTLSFYRLLPGQCATTADAGTDKYVCAFPAMVQLEGSYNGVYPNDFYWSPPQGLSNTKVWDPDASTGAPVFYVLTVKSYLLNENLVTNGDFEMGNTGFTSEYTYSPGNTTPINTYDIVTNGQSSNPALCDIGGNGNFLAAHEKNIGSLFCQTLSTTPYTEYTLAASVASIIGNPGLITCFEFTVNGVPVPPHFSIPGDCSWYPISTTYAVGATTSIDFCVRNWCGTADNPYAQYVDDIVVAPACKNSDTVSILLAKVKAMAAPAQGSIPCEGSPIALSGAGSSAGPEYSYHWETDAPAGHIVSGEDTMNPVVDGPGDYILTVTFSKNGTECTKTATVSVVISPNALSVTIPPPAPLGCGGTTATLTAFSNKPGSSLYSWTTLNGNISGLMNKSTATATLPGTYTVEVTDTLTGCTATNSVTVVQAAGPPILAHATAAGTISCTNPSVTLSGAGSSAGAKIGYVWQGPAGHILAGQHGLLATVDTAGLYILEVKDSTSGCFARDTVPVSGSTTLPAVSIQAAPTITCLLVNPTLSTAVTPPQAALQWSTGDGLILSGGNSLHPVVAEAGTYSLMATDTINHCSTVASVVVAENTTPPAPGIAPADTLTCIRLSVLLSATLPTPNSSWAWTTSGGGHILSGDQTLSPEADQSGSYTLTAVDTLNGCTATATVAVAADNAPVNVAASASNALDCIQGSSTLDGQIITGSGNLQWHWTTFDGHFISGESTAQAIVDAPGTYTWVAVNPASGCRDSAQVEVISLVEAVDIAASVDHELDCTHSMATLDGSALGGNNLQFSWSSPDGHFISGTNGVQALADKPGAYTLLAINPANGCRDSALVQVSSSAELIEISAGASNVLDCLHGTSTLSGTVLSGTGSLQFQWTTPDGAILSGGSTTQAEVNAPGLYTWLVSNPANGCQDSAKVQVSSLVEVIEVNAAASNVLDCDHLASTLSGTVLSGSGNLQLQWLASDGTIISSADTGTANAPGLYTWLAINPLSGCQDTAQVLVQSLAEPVSVSAAASVDVLDCTNGESTLTGTVLSGSCLQFQWSTADGHITSGGGSEVATVDAPGTYTWLAINPATGCRDSAQVLIGSSVESVDIAASASNMLDCLHGSSVLSGQILAGNANLQFQWSTAEGSIVSGGNTGQAMIDAPGLYILSALNPANGCSDTAQVQVNLNAELVDVMIISSVPKLTCADTVSLLEGMVLSGSGNLQFQWSSDNGQILPGGNPDQVMVNTPGTYTWFAVNPANGCQDSAQITLIADDQAPDLLYVPVDTLTCLQNQVWLSVSTSLFLVDWAWQTSNGHIVGNTDTSTVAVDSSGDYTVLLTNPANGCVAKADLFVVENREKPLIGFGSTFPLTCLATTEHLLAVVLVGQGQALLTWNTTDGHILSGENTPSPLIDAPGFYQLQATDPANGCMAQGSVQVTADTLAPDFSLASPAVLTCAEDTLTLSAIFSNPSPFYFFTWTASAGGQLAGDTQDQAALATAAGNYQLSVLDGVNGCSAERSLSLTEDKTAPVVDIAPPGLLTCVKDTLHLTAGINTGGAGYSAEWTTGNGHLLGNPAGSTVAVDSVGLYLLTVENLGNGCSASEQVSVAGDFDAPLISAGNDLSLDCHQAEIALQASLSSAGNIALLWQTGDGHFAGGTNVLQPLVDAAGTYLLLATDPANGCTATDEVLVVGFVPIEFSVGVQQPDCKRPTGTLEIGALSGGTQPFQFSLNGSDFQADSSFTGLPAGSYTMAVQDAAGCTATQEATLDAIDLPELSLPAMDTIFLGDSLQLLPALDIPDALVQEWLWSPATGLSCANCSQPWAQPHQNTLYRLTITAPNGCQVSAATLVYVNQSHPYYAPNAFSPNGDGNNDHFTLFGPSILRIREMRVFDRWGEELFYRKNFAANVPEEGWDGRFRLRSLMPAVFTWMAIVEFVDGQTEVLRGDVTLLRN